MDLLATVRKEGARGGRGDFKWADVQSSTHRENYLGHSLMAPVGRWQKGRDLNWYAKGDAENQEGETDAERAARERKEEIKRVKEAEQDALAKALGFEVMPKNPNMEALGDRREMDRILKASAAGQDDEASKGVGFGAYQGKIGPRLEDSTERMEGNRERATRGIGVTSVGEVVGVEAESDEDAMTRRTEGTQTEDTMRDAGRGRETDGVGTQILDHPVVSEGVEIEVISREEKDTEMTGAGLPIIAMIMNEMIGGVERETAMSF